MADRIKFAGDPEIKETGSGQEPQIPLPKSVAPTSVEMLNQEPEKERPKPDFSKNAQRRAAAIAEENNDDEDEDEVEAGPTYSREHIAARIGEPLEEAQSIAAVEAQLNDDDVVPLLFPAPVKLQDKGIMHNWATGVHLVPVSLAGRSKKEMHWWLRHNGVRRAGSLMPSPNKE